MPTASHEINPDWLAPYPMLAAVRDTAQRGDWHGLQAAYAALDSWALRTAAVTIVGELPGVEHLLAPAADDEHATLARCLLASHHVEVGWAARTDARAQFVSRDQFTIFHDHLRRAERLLIDVTAREPDNVAAWTIRMITVRGLELGLSEAERRWAQIARHEPHHLAGQVQMLQQLCPKWSGTLDQMHLFAQERAMAAPAGSLNAVLVIEAHLEHWATLDGRRQREYLASPPVRQAVAQAAAHSVLHPDFRPRYGWTSVHSYFALYHSMIGDLGAAAVHFRALGPYVLPSVWGYYFGEPERVLQAHRSAALARG